MTTEFELKERLELLITPLWRALPTGVRRGILMKLYNIRFEDVVWESNIPPNASIEFRKHLDSATGENSTQDYLKANRELLALFTSGGHGKWVVPKPKFGSEYVPDFVIGSKDSIGFNWVLVELEPVDAKMWNQDGTQSERLRGGIKQILDWRLWLQNNLQKAQKTDGDGLAFPHIDPRSPGIVFISRAAEEDKHPLKEKVKAYRRQIEFENNISIRSFDSILVELDAKREFLQRKLDIHTNHPFLVPLDPELPQPDTETIINVMRADFYDEYKKWASLIENPPSQWKDIEPAIKEVTQASGIPRLR